MFGLSPNLGLSDSLSEKLSQNKWNDPVARLFCYMTNKNTQSKSLLLL